MPMRRDPATGLVGRAYVDPMDNPYYKNPKNGDIRRTFLKHLDEERKEEMEQLNNLIASGKIDEATGPPPKFEIDLDDPLFAQESNSANAQDVGCYNARDRPGMWAGASSERITRMVDSESPFLNRLAHICVKAQIWYCRNEECVRNRAKTEKIVPQCEWSRFREWASSLISCQMSFSPEQKLTRPHTHLSAAANIGHWLLIEYKHQAKKLTGTLVEKEDKTSTLDLFGVCEVIYWMITIQTSIGLCTVIEDKWGPEFLPSDITSRAVTKATRRARKLGLCQNRVWNLALVTERKHVDLPELMETAKNHPQLRHDTHDACTAGFCRFTHIDSTKVRQLHKCEDSGMCEQVKFKFDPQMLNESIKKGGRSVWGICEPFKVSQDAPYVAVSHVWSDGTGIGLQEVGEVNRCLFNYLAGVARKLGCEAIWWDTISIPTDKEARRKAINEMHENYSSAEYTIVHDQYLLNFDWADDGSPCLALVFSPWLTRGWTALELIMSKKVKVLYKGNEGLVIKDLDDDILADDPSRCSRAHWIASSIIRRLREPIKNVTDLMAVLKPRSTSRAWDRMVIAGLLSGLADFDYNLQQDEITKAIVDRVSKIAPSSLLHGQVTISESCGWSWCPSSLYDIPANALTDLLVEGTVGDKTCVVDKDGVIAGSWYCRLLEREDSTMQRLVPNSTYMSVILKIEDALRHWRHCLLLRENWQDRGPALLVTTVGRECDFIHCRFVGSVHEFTPPPLSGGYDSRYNYASFKIGNEGDRSNTDAKNFFKKDSRSARKHKEDYTWLRGKLWMGDHRFTGQLLVSRFIAEAGAIEGFSLQVTNKTVSPKPHSLDDVRVVYYCDPEVSLSQEPVFHVGADSGHGANRKSRDRATFTVLSRVDTASSWPPNIIPAKDRTKVSSRGNGLSHSKDYSNELFRLEEGTKTYTFAAIELKLFTPDEESPYRGIWTGIYPGQGYEFLLFHQPNAKRLEVIKLTGDRYVPRGAYSVIAEDLGDVKRICTGKEWLGAPAVAAKVQVAGDGFANNTFTPVELVLVNKDEVMLILELIIIQLKRVDLGGLLSETDRETV